MSFIGASDGEVPVALARVGMGVFRYIKASYGFWWLLYGCVGGASGWERGWYRCFKAY